MASSRRVKKGPGRRPQSAKRQRFMELRARGWSVRAAAREVGVSRSAATNWTRGYKTYRNGVEVGFVPPLDRLEVRSISARYLSQEERIEIADLRQSGLSIRARVSPLEWWGFGSWVDGTGCVVTGVGVGHRVVVSELPTK